MNSYETKDVLVSVVIPSYKSEDTIDKTLASLMAQKTTFGYEVIVVNSSEDSTATIVREQFPSVTLIQLKVPTLAGPARNIGAGNAAGRYVAFLDSDCIVASDWLERLLAIHSDDYCAVGGSVSNANPEGAVSWAGYMLEFCEFFAHGKPTVTNHVPSGNYLIEKRVFEEAGGFPEDFPAQDDRYFNWILMQRTGKPLFIDPTITVDHYHRYSFSDFKRHQIKIGRGGVQILRSTDMRWSGLVAKRALLTLLLPIAPIPKLLRVIFRTIRWKPSIVLRHPHVLVIVGLGMIYWTIGFAQELYQD